MLDLSVGYDRGNRELNTIVRINGQSYRYRETSVVGTANLQNVHNKSSAAGTDVNLSENALHWNGETYLVGASATRWSEDATEEFNDMNRYYSPRAKAALLTSIANTVQRSHPGQDNVKARVVTGIPLLNYDDDFCEKIVRELGGSYHFRYMGRDCHIQVEVIKVLLEGAGAAIATGMLKKGGPTVCVVDSGSRTSNFLRFDGNEPKLEVCKTVTVGVKQAMELLVELVWNMYKITLDDADINALFRAYTGQRAYPEIPVNGTPIAPETLIQFMEMVFKKVDKRRHHEISALWGEKDGEMNRKFNYLHVGGGAHLFNKWLRALIPAIKCPDEPEWSNAIGYAAYAEAKKLRALRSA